MSVREAMQRSKALSATAAVVMILIAGGAIVYQAFRAGPDRRVGEVFFTTDDGKTWFPGPADRFPPFQHEGRTAVQAVVWAGDGGKTKFVSHLVRYTPEGQKKATALRKGADPSALQELPGNFSWREVKRPGAPESDWISDNDPKARDLMQPVLPPGVQGPPQRVAP
jgi:hypothetical protein